MNIYFCHVFRQRSSLLWRTRKLVVEEDDVHCYKCPKRNFLVYLENPNVFQGLHLNQMSDATHFMNAEVSFASPRIWWQAWLGQALWKFENLKWKWFSLSFFLLLLLHFSNGSKSMLAFLSTRMIRLHQQTFWHLLPPYYHNVLYCREH